MTKIRIRVEKNVSLIDEAFNDIEYKGLFKKAQLKVFSSVYKSKLNGLYLILKRRVREYITKQGDNYFIAEDEGEKIYCLEQKRKLEKFLFGDEKELNEEKEYNQFKNDRIVHKIIRHLRIRGTKAKDGAIKSALGEGRVFDFFNRAGILIEWEVID